MEGSDSAVVIDECPDCEQSVDVSALHPFSEIQCPHCASQVHLRRTMGQYVITELLGEGGMSLVYKATDMHLQREVALKILHQALSEDESLTAMFEREAKLTASILHPNVVKVYTVGRDQGYFFIAMEVIDASSLEQLIFSKGAIGEQEVLRVARDVTSGLGAAFDEGLIHRDIKPGNMLMMDDGTTKLVDFGLAVQQGGEDESEDLWATPFYVPPEKLDGDADTHHGDIYSLGATLYHAIAGKPPFEANTSSMEELKEIKKQTLKLKADAPGASKLTIKLIDDMMAYRPENRPQTYDEILDRIDEIEQKQFGIAHPRDRDGSAGKKSPLILVALGVLGLLAIGAVAMLVGGSKTGDDGRATVSLSSDDLVISHSDSHLAERFLKGRKLLVDGQFDQAEKGFDQLLEEEEIASTTRAWGLYFQGLSRLFQGREVEARRSFRQLKEFAATGEVAGSLGKMMGWAGAVFAEPLPMIDGRGQFAGTESEPLLLLTAGLKNWQLGQFESAARLFDGYDQRIQSQGEGWVKEMGALLAPYRADWDVLRSLPNPRVETDEDLDAVEAQLREAIPTVQTPVAASRLIEHRLSRLGKIRVALEELESPELPAEMEISPEELAKVEQDRLSLRQSMEEASELQKQLEFGAIADSILELQMETDQGVAWRDELVLAYRGAEGFVPLLADLISEKGYQGNIGRRQGPPLDAKITLANETVFQVDLGFGPTDVKVEEFAPKWMLFVAAKLLGSPNEATYESWETLIYFGFCTDRMEWAERHAGPIVNEHIAFRPRWERLVELSNE